MLPSHPRVLARVPSCLLLGSTLMSLGRASVRRHRPRRPRSMRRRGFAKVVAQTHHPSIPGRSCAESSCLRARSCCSAGQTRKRVQPRVRWALPVGNAWTTGWEASDSPGSHEAQYSRPLRRLSLLLGGGWRFSRSFWMRLSKSRPACGTLPSLADAKPMVR